MKRTCNRCVALEQKLNGLGCYCSLGHEIEATKTIYGDIPIAYKPKEQCEKPLTFISFAEITNTKFKH